MTKPSQHRQTSVVAGARAALLALPWMLLAGCAVTPQAGGDAAAIRALLERQVSDWNAGDLEGFMRAYLQARETRFASGDHAGRGWDQALARYRLRFPEGSGMGRLAFGEVEVESLGRHHALAFGRWRLDAGGTVRHGLFTLVLARTVDGWKIVHDHTSAGTAPVHPAKTP